MLFFNRIGVALTYFAIQHSYFLTLLTYGCLNGIGVGIGYLTPLEVAMRVIHIDIQLKLIRLTF